MEQFPYILTKPLSRVTPNRLKSIRQSMRLRKALQGRPPTNPTAWENNGGSIFYILGSGASILHFDFSNPEFSQSPSVGINDVIFFNDLLPSYSYELTLNKPWRPFYHQKQAEVLSSGTSEFVSQVPLSLKVLSEYPDKFWANPDKCHLYASMDAIGEKGFRRQLEWYLRRDGDNTSPGLDPGFSLGRLIVRALKLGFTDIRLGGIDLISGEHFWHFDEEFSWMRKVHQPHLDSRGHSQNGHKTNSMTNRWPARVFLEHLSGISSDFGFELRAQKDSGASKFLDVWN